MRSYYIWYNAKDAKYFYGSESQFYETAKRHDDSLIIAEEFTNLTHEFAQKITNKLNENLIISNQRI